MVGKQISAEELHVLLEQGLEDSIIVDVRTPEEFKKGAITGAVNMPLNDILGQIENLKSYKTIYVYCLSGGRSELALLQLSSSGLSGSIVNLTSGMLAWRQQGYPVVQ